MKKEFYIRKIDDLGRICIPARCRKILNINNDDLIEISISKNGILLQKNIPEIDYNGIIASSLVMKAGNQYKDYTATKEEIFLVKDAIDKITENLIKDKNN